MTLHAAAHLHPHLVVAPVRRRTFGSFVEHMARCVHTGVFEPGHPSADADGLRTDVLELVRELGVSSVRYPGGNFVSGYRWEDGVGPLEDRPVRRDLAWHSTEPNTFGLDEFMTWCDAADVEPMYAVNLGTRGTQEALDVLEYANGEVGTDLADHRALNGHPEPYDVRMWCLGNEMDGPWQLGHVPARDYGVLAAETARAMRRADPDLELVACGSSHSAMPTFGSWEQAVLEAGYDAIDMLSAHVYYRQEGEDRASYLASADDMDAYIDAVVATSDHVRALKGDDKHVMISFDEWNVVAARGDSGTEPSGDDWPVAPRFAESTYSAQDAVVVGSLLISLLRHTDRVASASQAQLVNVLAPIRTEPGGRAWRQSIFHPFALTSRHARGQVLQLDIDSPTTPTRKYGDSAVLDAVATWDADGGALTVFAVNRSADDVVDLGVPLLAFGNGTPLTVIEAALLNEKDPDVVNTAGRPDRVVPRAFEDVHLEDARLSASLPPISWAMIRLERRG
ncbi:alpha-L-arabinofuranosidase [Brachybacterium endophyticum]|uniref:non-reducing end alpha-L-arabinofuranosidase n=1 Tax=Brachybacterium endophyticum TaxID=2182385 RepID=A0A2U2RML1_9MICO|nr:alpha-L-arabinofuranosidase C-terminal domain-containing protein [Brachybacterium endophyticum]PWH07110.1 alpha-L-arabinofuranosidase [Brachybacterium endophyticum]